MLDTNIERYLVSEKQWWSYQAATSRSAVTDKLCCMVGKPWQIYRWKRNCAPNIVGTRQAQLPLRKVCI